MKSTKSFTMFDCLDVSDEDLAAITNVCVYINEYEHVPPASYVKERDKICVYVKPIYLPAAYSLPLTKKELNENDFLFYNYFTLFILDGSIFPKMTVFQKYYFHQNSDVISQTQENIKNFTNTLKKYKINTKRGLVIKWKIDKSFLKEEMISLIEQKCNTPIQLMDKHWPPLEEL